jgi:hypothetical protein
VLQSADHLRIERLALAAMAAHHLGGMERDRNQRVAAGATNRAGVTGAAEIGADHPWTVS